MSLRSRSLSVVLSLLSVVLLTVGCGSSTGTFVFSEPGNSDSPVDVGEATIVLQSDLESARAITRSVTKLVFTTTSTPSKPAVVSAPITKAPVVKVAVPADSTKLVIDYVDSSNTVVEKWGTDIKLEAGKEFIIIGVDPIKIAEVREIAIIPPIGAGAASQGTFTIPRSIGQPFRAEVTTTSNTVQDITDLADWSLDSAPNSSVTNNGIVLLNDATATLRVNFLGRSGSKALTGISVGRDLGAPLTVKRFDSDLPFQVGEIVRYSILARFNDNVQRELAPDSVSSFDLSLVTGSGQELVSLRPQNLGAPKLNIKLRPNDQAIPTSVFSVGDYTRFFLNPQLLQSAPLNLDDTLIASDLNGDGKVDVAGTNGTLSSLLIHRGNGDGTFQAAITENTGLAAGGQLLYAVNDFNNDGFQDVALASNQGAVLRVRSGKDGVYQSIELPGVPRELLTLSQKTSGSSLSLITTDNSSVFLSNTSTANISFSSTVVTFAGGIASNDRFGVLNSEGFAIGIRDIVQLRNSTGAFETHLPSSGQVKVGPRFIGSGSVRDFETFTGFAVDGRFTQGLLAVIDETNQLTVSSLPNQGSQGATRLTTRIVGDQVRRLLPCTFKLTPKAASGGVVGAMFVIGDSQVRLLNSIEAGGLFVLLSEPILPGIDPNLLRTAVTADFNNDRLPDLVGLANSRLVTVLSSP
jgi:FG-GAP-like repeat